MIADIVKLHILNIWSYTMKICTKCKTEKELEDFKKDSNKKDGRYSSCKECNKKDWKDNYQRIAEKHRKKNNEYRKNNASKVKEYHDKYYNENKDKIFEYGKRYKIERRDVYLAGKKAWKANIRAKKYDIDERLFRADIQMEYDIQGGKCYYCGIDMGLIYTIDHKIPLIKRGPNTRDNIVCACMQCNMSKGTKSVDEYLKIIGRSA